MNLAGCSVCGTDKKVEARGREDAGFRQIAFFSMWNFGRGWRLEKIERGQSCEEE